MLQPSATAFIGQDAGLTLFHALGKLLYNKRDAPGASTQAELSQSAEAPSTQGQQAQHARHAQQSQQLHQMEHAEHSGNGVIDLVTDDEGGEDVPNTSQAQDVVAPGHWCGLSVMLHIPLAGHAARVLCMSSCQPLAGDSPI